MNFKGLNTAIETSPSNTGIEAEGSFLWLAVQMRPSEAIILHEWHSGESSNSFEMKILIFHSALQIMKEI